MADGGALFADTPLQRYLSELADAGHAPAPLPHFREDPNSRSTDDAHREETDEPAAAVMTTAPALCPQVLTLAGVLLRSPLLLEDDALLVHALDPTLFANAAAVAAQAAAADADATRNTAGRGRRPSDGHAPTTALRIIPGLPLLSAAAILAGVTAALVWQRGATLALARPVNRRVVGVVCVGSAAVAAAVATTAIRRLFRPEPASTTLATSAHVPLTSPLPMTPAASAAECLAALEALALACGRGLRQVQEAELLARGFRLALQLPPVARMEGGDRERACLSLRQATDAALRLQLADVRACTLALRRAHPVAYVWDASSRLHADCPLADFGIPEADCCDLDELARATEGWSLRYLKEVFHMYNIHVSELLRRLAVGLAPAAAASHTAAADLAVAVPALLAPLASAARHRQRHVARALALEDVWAVDPAAQATAAAADGAFQVLRLLPTAPTPAAAHLAAHARLGEASVEARLQCDSAVAALRLCGEHARAAWANTASPPVPPLTHMPQARAYLATARQHMAAALARLDEADAALHAESYAQEGESPTVTATDTLTPTADTAATTHPPLAAVFVTEAHEEDVVAQRSQPMATFEAAAEAVQRPVRRKRTPEEEAADRAAARAERACERERLAAADAERRRVARQAQQLLGELQSVLHQLPARGAP